MDIHEDRDGLSPLSEATFYAWKAKFAGMDVSDAKRLKVLEEEDARLKRLLAVEGPFVSKVVTPGRRCWIRWRASRYLRRRSVVMSDQTTPSFAALVQRFLVEAVAGHAHQAGNTGE